MGTDDTSDKDTDDKDTDDKPDTGDDGGQTEAEKWKRLARRHEARSKANHDELERLKAELGSANQSDMDKLRSTIDELKNDLVEERRKATIADVAGEKGLTKAQAARLKGNTREELEADADDIVEAFGIKPGKGKTGDDAGDQPGDKPGDDKGGTDAGGDKPAGSGRPKENLRPGAAGESDVDDVDPDKIAESILKSPF